MPTFDPDQETGRETLPAGRYGVAFVWFKRKQARNGGGDYLNVKCEVTHGPKKGKAFFTMVSLDLTKSGAVFRLKLLSQCVGVKQAFEVGSFAEGTDSVGDENFERLFLRKPFLAEVGIEKRQKGAQEFENNTIERILTPDQWPPDEKLEMDVWQTTVEEDRGEFGAPDDDDEIPF